MTLRDVLSRYAILQNLTDRTVELYGHTLDRFAEFVGHEPTIDDIDDLVVAGFLRWRAATPRKRGKPSAASVAKDKSQLTALANWAAKKRLKRSDGKDVEFLSLPRMRKIRHAPQAYTVDEVSRMIRLAKQRIGFIDGKPAAWWWSTLLYAAWCSGERIGALLDLKWQDVDLDGMTLLFRAETRKGRCADIQRAITPDLAAMLRVRAGNPGDRVWLWDRAYHSLWPSLRLLCRRAGVRGTGFHRLRKSSASYVALGGGDATEHLGHSSPEMTRQHYLDPRITSPKKALDYLPKLDLDGKKGGGKPPEKPADAPPASDEKPPEKPAA